MCGIAAIVSSSPVAGAPIRPMMDLVRHRGPNDEGYLFLPAVGAEPLLFGGPATPADAYVSGTAFAPSRSIDEVGDQRAVVALGFRRLSILDLSVLGHQPMCTPDRRYWIVFNGEIYNYRELGEELRRAGHSFISHSDTEVILAAFAEWGPECLARLNGMWAFVIYDALAGDVFAARDRFGIKPLYYWIAPGGAACFASEIKQFTAMPGWHAKVNTARAEAFLDTGLTDASDETMFDGVFQLRPGELVRARIPGAGFVPGSRIAVEQWYTLQAAPFAGSFEDAASECRRLLTDSVRLMLRSDVPIGSCLSGGVDSSSIVCVARQLLQSQGSTGQQRTFSFIAPAAALDEKPWIDAVVASTGVDAFFTTTSVESLQDSLSTLTWHQDEPVTSTSVFAQWSVFALAAANGMKVMLDGQGADEAFAGYHSFFPTYVAGLLRTRGPAHAWRELAAITERHHLRRLGALREIASLLLSGTAGGETGVASFSLAQLTGRNLQMLLRFEDRNSMAHSIEARVPFLDHRLVEFALGLPDDYKIGGGVTKRVLRSAMSGILPDRIRDRVDKLAFDAPEADWLRDQQAWFRSRLEQAVEISDRFVPASLLVSFDAMMKGARPFDRRHWRAVSFGQWMQAFAAGAPTRAQWRRAQSAPAA